MCQVWFHAFSVKSDQGSQRRPKGIAVYVNFSILPSLVITQVKKALKLPSHRYLPTPTTFHFLPYRYIFAPISLFSRLFQAISPPFLVCIFPLSSGAKIPWRSSELIECFHSRGQHLCKFIGTKEIIWMRKKLNSPRTGLGHQHGHRFIVLGHQYGRRDVTWKHPIGKFDTWNILKPFYR